MSKIKLVLGDERSRAIWANAERTAQRVAKWPKWKRSPEFLVRLTCCGRDDGVYGPVPWGDADQFRESYLQADGHDRSAIIEDAP